MRLTTTIKPTYDGMLEFQRWLLEHKFVIYRLDNNVNGDECLFAVYVTDMDEGYQNWRIVAYEYEGLYVREVNPCD